MVLSSWDACLFSYLPDYPMVAVRGGGFWWTAACLGISQGYYVPNNSRVKSDFCSWFYGLKNDHNICDLMCVCRHSKYGIEVYWSTNKCGSSCPQKRTLYKEKSSPESQKATCYWGSLGPWAHKLFVWLQLSLFCVNNFLSYSCIIFIMFFLLNNAIGLAAYCCYLCGHDILNF